jgi:hypothetical protein
MLRSSIPCSYVRLSLAFHSMPPILIPNFSSSPLRPANTPLPPIVDDNSMLFGATIMLHRLFTHSLTPLLSTLVFVLLNTFVCITIYAHIVLGESSLHQIVFASMMLTSATRTHRLITSTVKDRAVKRQMRVVGSWALGELPNFGFCFVLFSLRRGILKRGVMGVSG